MKPVFITLSIVGLLTVAVIGWNIFAAMTNQQKLSIPFLKQCTLEAKMCPDGSSVGRTGPNCEFAVCPNEVMNPTPDPNDTSSSGPLATYNPNPNEPSSSGEKITISGKMICLPHKNTSGPQTMECAIGMKADNGKNYALSDPQWKFLIGIGTEEKVKATGVLKPPTNDKYDTVGTIELTNLTKE